MDSFWHQIKQDAQYQQEDIMNWVVHLEHLQSMLKEFDSVAAFNKELLIWYFREGLWPSIQAQIDSRHQELDS